ncbi:MAG: membrane-bound lytic murein transglycosylase D, partial [Planctomycetota bacterium]
MLKMRIITIIIAFNLTACNTLPERQANSSATNAPDTSSEISHTRTTGHRSEQNPVAIVLPEPDDVWLRIRDQLGLDHHVENASVKARIAWYARHQAHLDRVAERARPYIYHIVEELEKRNMPLELALLPIVESAYQPFAYSRSHASGIWQFIPGTGKHYGLKQNWWYDGRRDIVAATDAALRYLEKLNKEFNGDWLHSLAAYNTGERNVARAIARNKKAGKPIDFWSLRLPRETRGYVPSLLAVAELLAKPDLHAVQWQPIENKPYFTQVDVEQQLDLATAAKLADISMDEIYTLNPAFNRWATDPSGPHYLLIPIEKSQTFITKLQSLPNAERISWKRHVIKRGESLSQIAGNYHSSVSAIKLTNNLRNNLIREGNSLLIPNSKQPLAHYTLSQDSRRYKGLKKSGNGKNHLYTVRSGDTLWDIGKHYDVSIKQLCAWNGLNPRSVLRPGKK